MASVRTVLDVLQLAAGHLASSGVDNPRLDAEVLLADLLGLERIQLYVQHDRPLEPGELASYRERIARRARREPVAYIVGSREFYSRPFRVDPRTLIPRPETEHLVDVTLERLARSFGDETEPRVAEIGCGSGAVVITLLLARPDMTAVATDLSPDALAVARENADKLGVLDRVEFRAGDLYAPIGGERFHAVVSNPPYVSDSEYASLPPDVRMFEPWLALKGGPDGLDVVRRLVSGAEERLVPGGFLALEIGAGQGCAVEALAAAQGMLCERVVPDLAGRDRVAVIAPREGRA